MCHCAVNSAHGGCAHVSSTHASVARVSSGKHDAASGYPLLALRTYMRRANAVSERIRTRQNLSEASGRSAIAIAQVLHQWLRSRFSKNSLTTSGPCLYACISEDQAAGSVQKLLEKSRISFRVSSKIGTRSELATILTRRLFLSASIKHLLHPSHSHASLVPTAHDPCALAAAHSSPPSIPTRWHAPTSVQLPPVPSHAFTSSQLNSSRSNAASS
mmetsp:Transcript_3910/g.17399  ORF Transcript_3910/g.17399 Transcript_3910/m.17399 type:complete len:216 (-) Transcript_3910:1080-1727(-)